MYIKIKLCLVYFLNTILLKSPSIIIVRNILIVCISTNIKTNDQRCNNSNQSLINIVMGSS